MCKSEKSMFCVVAAMLLCASLANAYTTISSAQSGNWSSTATWAGGVVPGLPTDLARIVGNNTVTVSTAIALGTSGQESLNIGNWGDANCGGTLNIVTGGNLTPSGNMFLGHHGTAYVNVSGTGMLSVQDALRLGRYGNTYVTITGGSIYAGQLRMSDETPTYTSTLEIDGGWVKTSAVANMLNVGAGGSINIAGGKLIVYGTITDVNAYIAASNYVPGGTGGHISAYGGSGSFVYDYTSTPGYTTITAKLPLTPFTGGVTRQQLDAILSKSITISPLTVSDGGLALYFTDNMRLIGNLQPKYIGRAAYTWGVNPSVSDYNMADDEAFFTDANDYAIQVHNSYPDIILEACICETAYSAYNANTPARVAEGFSGAGVEQIPVPAWVFTEFGETPVTRNFSYNNMIYADGRYNDHWLPGTSVPDISRPEAQKWYYYRARRFIDSGYEAIHFGQIDMISQHDTSHTIFQGLLTRIRNYAATHARRQWVFCNSHTRGIAVSGHLLFDFHMMPSRPVEVIGSPYQAIFQLGYADSIYGNSLGGTSPSGWSCAALPYAVELDNYGGSNGDPAHAATSDIWVWGWDEISWFANLPEQSRNNWLWYANGWIAANDPNGHLMMPVSRVVASDDAKVGEGYASWGYHANTFNGNCTQGFNQEETIKKIWYSGCKAYSKADFNGDCNVDLKDFANFAAFWMNDAGRTF